MKLILVIVIAVGLVFSYQYLDEKSKREKAEARAQEEAYREDSVRRQGEEKVKSEAERTRLAAQREAERIAAARPAMGVSKVVEPLLVQIMARLDPADPSDLVPSVEITKQRILDKRGHAEAERLPVFDRATKLFDSLIALSEERTKYLEEMLKNKLRSSTTLDRPAGPSSGDFFNRNVMKRWEEVLARSRPIVSQQLDQLRLAEREWNKLLRPTADVEMYDLPGVEKVLITVNPAIQSESSLGSIPKNGQVSHPWRNGYYTRYHYIY